MSRHEAHQCASALGHRASRWASRRRRRCAPRKPKRGSRRGAYACSRDPSGHNPAIGNSSPAGRCTGVPRRWTRASTQQHLEEGGAPAPLLGETQRRRVDAREFGDRKRAPARINVRTGGGHRSPARADLESEMAAAAQYHRRQGREGGQWKWIGRGGERERDPVFRARCWPPSPHAGGRRRRPEGLQGAGG